MIERPLAELSNQVSTGKITARSLVEESLSRIASHEDFHTVLQINERALEQADAIDRDVSNGRTGRLLGVPYMAKDNFLTFDTATTAASKILSGDHAYHAPYQATAIERLSAEGAIMVAKSNMDEFAHGSSTENSAFGPSKNPRDPRLVPGGSSGGSAAAVALGLASFALGTDTGGSIRQPAAFCGVVGLKPTYGLVSRYGVIAMASSTDVIGPLTRTVDDAATVMDVIAGVDVADATTIERAEKYHAQPITLSGVKFGLISEYLEDGIDEEVKSKILASVETIRRAGGIVETVNLPSVKLALPTYYILVPAEISSNLARYDGIKFGHRTQSAKNLEETYILSRGEGFGAETKRRILMGTYVLSSGYYDAYYKQAQQVRTLIMSQIDDVLRDYPFLIGPTTPTTAFALGAKTRDPLAMYASDVMTVSANLAGIPAISLPAGEVEGLPVGLQIMAGRGQDGELLNVAASVSSLMGDTK